LLEQLKKRAETLQQAISGDGDGTYGICEKCGKPIHPDRLAVLPDTRICIECARNAQ
jgi:DnaK suppressor protein